MDTRLIIVAILWMLAILINCIIYFIKMHKIDKKYDEKIREIDRKIEKFYKENISEYKKQIK